jgi:tetratricopeptide (TPR) repeat protein
MDSLPDRRLLIYLLRSEASDLPDVQEHEQARLHAVRIVMTCCAHPGGLRALRGALRLMAPATPGTVKVVTLIDSAALRAILPEPGVEQVCDLLRRASSGAFDPSWRATPPAWLSGGFDGREPAQILDDLASNQGGIDGPHPALWFAEHLADFADRHVADALRQWVAEQTAWLGVPPPEPPPGSASAENPDGMPLPDADSDGRMVTSGTNADPLPTATEPDETDIFALPDGPALDDTGDPMATIAPTVTPIEPLPRVWGDVPPRNPSFTGREELLKQLHGQLLQVRETAVLPQALHGMGGVGKSQLAIEYVHRHSQDYDLVWWISAEHQGQILGALTNLAQRLKLDTSNEANIAVPAVREALSTGQTGYRRWLLIFDNAENVEDVRQFFPTGGAGKILVTSRNQGWERVARTLEVDVFTRAESNSFLIHRASELTEHEASRLADALGDLPLAIEQAAAWRSATGMSVDQYLELLAAKQVSKRIELLRAMPSPDYGLSVAAAWDMSFDRLEETNQAAMQLLQICSFFAPEPISRDLFAGSPAAPITPELDEMLDDPIKLSRAIRDIQRYALAKFDHRSNTLQMHRLIQQVLMGRMSEEQRRVLRHGAHIMLANANPGNPQMSEQWTRYQALRAHLTVSGGLACKDSRVRQLVFNMVKFLYGWGDHEGCEAMAREVYANWNNLLGEDSLQSLQFGQYLAWILWVNGKYGESKELSERSLNLYRVVAGDEDEGTLDAMSTMARSLRAAGDFQESFELDKAALETARRVLGRDDPATLRIAHNLGVSLRLLGDFAASRQLDEQTYQVRCDVIGARELETLRTGICLIIDQREQGDYVGARALLEDVYQQCVDEFGPDGPMTLFAARNLAVGRRRAGDHEGAKRMSEETLRKLSRRYGDDYPETMSAALNLSVDLRHAGQLSEAIALGRDILVSFARKYGDHHPHTLSAQIDLAVALRLSDQVDEAYALDSASLELMRAALGPDHALTLTCATNLASDLYAKGDVRAAYEHDIDTLDRSRRTLGEDHPSTLACAANLALDLRALDRVGESDKIQSDTVTAFRRVLGEKHPATLNALQSLRADCDVDPIPL